MDIIQKYKPTASLSEAFTIDETLPDNEQTFDLLKKLVLAKQVQDVAFLTIGKILKIVRDRKLYKFLDFEDFSQFLSSEEVSFSREKAYLYIRVYELFVEKLEFNPDEIGKLGVVRLMMLAPLVKNIENKEDAIKKIDEVKDLRYNDFVKTVKEQTNKTGKPEVFWSEQHSRWVVNYYSDTTLLVDLGGFNGKN